MPRTGKVLAILLVTVLMCFSAGSFKAYAAEVSLGGIEDMTASEKFAATQVSAGTELNGHSASPEASDWNTFIYSEISGAEFSTVHENGSPVLSVSNSRSVHSIAEKYFALEPRTDYRVSVKMKTKNLIAEEKDGGANFTCLFSDEYPSTGFIYIDDHNYVGDNWQDFVIEFNSANHPYFKVDLTSKGNVSGEMFFSDLKIEKSDTVLTNKWNYLVLIYKDVVVDTVKDGKPFHYEDSLNDKTVLRFKEIYEDIFPGEYEYVANNRVDVDNVYVEIIDEPLVIKTEKSTETSFMIENEDVQARLKKYKNINEVVTILPIKNLGYDYGAANHWIVNSDGVLNHPFYVCVFAKNDDVLSWEGNIEKTEFVSRLFIHETLHSAEGIQRYELGLETPNLDNLVTDLKLNPNEPWITREGRFARGTLPDGKGGYTGLTEEAYYLNIGGFEVIHRDSMSVTPN